MKLTKKQRAEVRAMCNGRCAYCGVELPEKGWHADHVAPVQRRTFYRVVNSKWLPYRVVLGRPDRDVLENILPSCRSCNLYKGGCSLEGFRRQLKKQMGIAMRASKNIERAKLFGLVQIINKPVIFYFEALNGELACAPGFASSEPQLEGEVLCASSI